MAGTVLPWESREWMKRRLQLLEEADAVLERLRLDYFWEMEALRKRLEEESSECPPGSGTARYAAAAELVPGGVKITVKDVMPKRRYTRIPGMKAEVRQYWAYLISKAIEGLDERPYFDGRVHCRISAWMPGNTSDPDNMDPKPVIDALRRVGLIIDDSMDWLTYEMECRVDRENPRTEITVTGSQELPDKNSTASRSKGNI